MRLLLILCFLITLVGVGFTQQNHFIYIQSENKNSFFVRIEKKTFYSTSSGYVIVPKLAPNNYLLTIGFLKNQWPEQLFSVDINQQDEGFVLKNLTEKGWGLLNIGTTAVLNAVGAGNVSQQFSNDDFSKLLSATVADPSLMVINSETPVKESIALPGQVSPALVADTITHIAETVAQQKVYKNGAEEGEKGYLAVYFVQSKEHTDTVEIFIESQVDIVANKIESRTNLVEEIKTEKNILDTLSINSQTLVLPNSVVTEVALNNNQNNQAPALSFVKAENPVSKESSDSALSTSIVQRESKRINCTMISTDREFYKIRTKMAAAEEDPKINGLVRKLFREKCFNTDQIKNLSVLFLTEKGRYEFFEIAYPYVVDYENFPCLLEQINDNYYRNRFMALIQDN